MSISLLLPTLLKHTDEASASFPALPVTGLTADSRAVAAGYLFAALPGMARDGRAYIADAVARGATTILVPADTAPLDLPTGIAVIRAKEPRLTLARIAAAFYPQQPQTIVAVTGTSGKTSAVQFARELWQNLHYKAASIGTLGVIGGREKTYGTLTTPDAITLHKTLDQLAQEGITHTAMEASSHGLSMYRLDAVKIKTAGFTNLSRDHLDYHGTMEAYWAAKRRLFFDLLPHDGHAVINVDNETGATLAKDLRQSGHPVLTYGATGADLTLKAVQPVGDGLQLIASILGKLYDFKLPVMGQFQAHNALCALGMVIASGQNDVAAAVTAIANVSGVPGRLELAGRHKNGAYVFVDYAHKPDALEQVLTAIRPHVQARQGGKLIVLFGCGGNRDAGKRPMMGQIAQRLADKIIVTDDNPRHESPATIRAAIIAGCTPSPTLIEIDDRAVAIRQAVRNLHPGDVLVIAGKGHETGQIIGDVTLPFDDAEIARTALMDTAA